MWPLCDTVRLFQPSRFFSSALESFQSVSDYSNHYQGSWLRFAKESGRGKEERMVFQLEEN